MGLDDGGFAGKRVDRDGGFGNLAGWAGDGGLVAVVVCHDTGGSFQGFEGGLAGAAFFRAGGNFGNALFGPSLVPIAMGLLFGMVEGLAERGGLGIRFAVSGDAVIANLQGDFDDLQVAFGAKSERRGSDFPQKQCDTFEAFFRIGLEGFGNLDLPGSELNIHRSSSKHSVGCRSPVCVDRTLRRDAAGAATVWR